MAQLLLINQVSKTYTKGGVCILEKRAIQMAENDNVATMLCDAKAGDEVTIYDENHHQVCTMKAKDNIPYGNKISLYDIKKDEKIIKYGEKAGIVYRDITAGTLVHVHNVRSLYLDIPKTIIEEIVQEMHILPREEKVR